MILRLVGRLLTAASRFRRGEERPALARLGEELSRLDRRQPAGARSSP